MLFPLPARIPLKSDRAGDPRPPEGGPHASNLLNSRPSSLQGAKKSSFSQRSGHVPALPCPALRPHACLGLHKGHTRATAEVEGGEETPSQAGVRRRRRPKRGRRPALPLPSARAPHPASPLRRALGQRSHRSSSSSTGSDARRAARGRGPSVARTGVEGSLGDPGLGARLQCWVPRRDSSRPPRGSADQGAGAHKRSPWRWWRALGLGDFGQLRAFGDCHSLEREAETGTLPTPPALILEPAARTRAPGPPAAATSALQSACPAAHTPGSSPGTSAAGS